MLLGFFAVALGFKFRHPAVIVIGVAFYVAIAISYLLSKRQVRRVAVTIQRPSRVRAFQPFRVRVNASARGRAQGILAHYPWVPSMGVTAWFERVRGTGSVTVLETLTRRGAVELGPAIVSSSWPLGMWNAEARQGGGQRILVLPSRGEVRGPLRRAAHTGSRERRRPRFRRGDGTETWAVRPFVPGDSTRRIDWRSTARQGQLIVRELEDESGGTLALGLGWRLQRHGPPQRLIEAAVSLCATLIDVRFRAGGDTLLITEGGDPLRIAAGDRGALATAEDRLARLDGDVGWPDWSALAQVSDLSAVFLVHPGGEAPPGPAGLQTWDAGSVIDEGWFLPRGAVS